MTVPEREAPSGDPDEASRAFLSYLTHEVRTLISALFACADLLADTVQDRPDALQLVRLLREKSQHLRDLINNALELARLDSNRLILRVAPCDPGATVAQALALMQTTAREKGLYLRGICEGPVPRTIEADATRLRQILLNLLSNALKFTESGGVTVSLGIDAGETDGPAELRIRVRDTGPGIRAEDRQRVFEPFTQVGPEAVIESRGAGLGLTISRRLAEAMNGRLTLESEPDSGCMFTLALPVGSLEGRELTDRLPQVPELHAATRAPPLGEHLANQLAGMRVLVVARRPDRQLLFSAVLKAAGARVQLAATSGAALEVAMPGLGEATAPDVILLDAQQGWESPEGVRRLRNRGYTGAVMVILPDGQTPKEAPAFGEQEWQEAGCNECLTGPVNAVALTAVVARSAGRLSGG